MRKTPLPILDKCRLHNIEKYLPFTTDYLTNNTGNIGVFKIKQEGTGKLFIIISSDSGGWDHVSAHILHKGKKKVLPTWNDMCWIKNLFFDKEEAVVQFHPKESEYINLHETTLHLWKLQEKEFPLPDITLL